MRGDEAPDADGEFARWALHDGEVHLPISGEKFRLSVHDIGELPVPSGRLAIGDVIPEVVVLVPSGAVRVFVTRLTERAGWSAHVSHLSLLVPGRREVRRALLGEAHVVPARGFDLAPGERANDVIFADSGHCWCVDESAMHRANAKRTAPRSPACTCSEASPVQAAIEPLHEGADSPLAAFSAAGLGDEGGYRVYGGVDESGAIAAVHIDFGTIVDYDPGERATQAERRPAAPHKSRRRSDVGCVLAIVGLILLIGLAFDLFRALPRH